MPIKSKFPDLKIPDVSLHNYVFQYIKTHGNKVAMIDNTLKGKSITFEEIYNQARKCAGFLYHEGLRKGDSVGLCAPTCLEFPVALLAIISCGATATPCNPEYTKGEILQQFEISRPRMVLVHENAVETMKKVSKSLPFLEKLFVIGKSKEYTTFDSMLHDDYLFPNVEINPWDDIALLPYSSGTTGLPKCVMLSHRSLVSITAVFTNDSRRVKNDMVYTDRPMYHAGGFFMFLSEFVIGTTLVFEKEFKIEEALAAIEKYRITHLLAVPPMLISMANTEAHLKYDTSSLRFIMCGGAVLAPDILRRVKELYNLKLLPIYGMTEGGLLTINNVQDKHPSSVGVICSNIELKIIDLHDNRELGVNEDGEILVKTPQLFKGYLKNPVATKQALDEEGWYHTGDIGHFDDNEMVYIVDRIKEVIKYKTFQVPPAELENVILKHSKVRDVGVIGIPDKLVGEIPKAFVVKKDDSLTEQEIIQFVAEHLTDYKHLRGGVQFVEKIPKSPLGKIQRNELKKIAGFV